MDHTSDGQLPYSTLIWRAIASAGWYVVAIGISLWYMSPYISEKYWNWKQRREEQEYAAKYQNDPDLLQQRLSVIEASRQKMQEEYYQKSLIARQEEIERKERKKEALRLIDPALSRGQRLGSDTDDSSNSSQSKTNSARREYNPLMGDSSRGYRPPKRSCCGKGGCG